MVGFSILPKIMFKFELDYPPLSRDSAGPWTRYSWCNTILPDTEGTPGLPRHDWKYQTLIYRLQ